MPSLLKYPFKIEFRLCRGSPARGKSASLKILEGYFKREGNPACPTMTFQTKPDKKEREANGP